MKTTFRRVVSFIMAMAMVLSLGGLNAFAITETDGEIVTISATNVTATESDAVQTVNVVLYMDKDAEVSNIDAQISITDTDNMGVTFAGGATFAVSSMTSGDTNLPAGSTTGGFSMGDVNAGHHLTLDSTLNGYVLVTIPISIPANAVGTATVNFSGLNIADYDNASGYTLASTSAAATITVTEPTVDGYTAGVSVTGSTVTVGNTVTVNVGVSHSEDEFYNAGEIVLEYDSTYLTLDTTSLGELKYTNENGVLTIEDFGADKSFGTSNYAVVFTTAQVGTTTVELTSAKFVHKDNADESDLVAATLSPASVEITINEVTYDVTLPTDGNITGNSVATKGEDYTFTAAESDHYDYEITVTVGGDEIDTVTGPDVNGTYTIPNTSIDDDIVITYTREAKTYSVTVDGNEQDQLDKIILPADKPTYKVDYTFTIPENKLPTTTSKGYNYTVTVSVNGEEYNPDVNGYDYTIFGTDITGDIEIYLYTEVLDETPIPQVTVTVEGSTDVKVNGAASATVDEGSEVTLTLSAETGYNYVVMVGNEDVSESILRDKQYTFTASADVTVTVTKTLDKTSVAVYQYITLNTEKAAGGFMWLVTFNTTLDGKVPTYNGEVMYWSDKYNAYCWLVIANNLSVDSAKNMIDAATGTVREVNYSMNINGTTAIDAADAQVVWNMYSKVYNGFDEMSMAKFLAADQNGDATSTTKTVDDAINVDDAAMIIDAILDGTAK